MSRAGGACSIEIKSKISAIARAAAETKAESIVIVDMRKQLSLCDFFVIASGRSTTQVRAISDNIVERLKKRKKKISPWHIEGKKEGLWILLDYGNIVVHLFYDQIRGFYNLERLWGDAPQRNYRPRIRKPAQR